MQHGTNETFSHVLIDKVLEFSGWNLLDSRQVRFELNTKNGHADYLLIGQRGTLAVLEAKCEDVAPTTPRNKHAVMFGKGVKSQRPIIVQIPFDKKKAEEK